MNINVNHLRVKVLIHDKNKCPAPFQSEVVLDATLSVSLCFFFK